MGKYGWTLIRNLKPEGFGTIAVYLYSCFLDKEYLYATTTHPDDEDFKAADTHIDISLRKKGLNQ